MKDGRYYHKSCFEKESENKDEKDEYPAPKPNPFSNNDQKNPESPLSDRIKQLKKDIEHYKKKKNDVPTEKEKQGVQELINKLEKELKYERAKEFFAKKKGKTAVISKNRITGKATTVVNNSI